MGGTARLGLVACAVVGLAAGTAGAGVVYTDIPDIPLSADFGVAVLDLDRNGSAEFNLVSFAGGFGGPSLFTQLHAPAASVLVDPELTLTHPSRPFWADRLALGVSIGPTDVYRDDTYLLAAPDLQLPYGAWLDSGEAYLGVRFNIAGYDHFGWVRVTRTQSVFPVLAIVHDFAYESEPGVPIAAGAVPGPGGAGVALALAAWSGMNRRRRA